MTRPILVTGGAGFVGRHLLDRLVADGAGPLVAWSRPGGRQPDASGSFNGRVRWEEVDVLQRADVQAAVARARPTAVYHLAGAAHAGRSWEKTVATCRANVLGTHYLLTALHERAPDARVLLPGSALVYRAAPEPLGEDAPTGPTSPYALSKLAQEMLGTQEVALHGSAVLLTRSFNHLGPRQEPTYAASSFAEQIALIEAGLEEPILRVGNLDARRDFTDVRDTVRAYQTIVSRGTPGRPYNVCSGRALPIADVLAILLRHARVRVEVVTEAERQRPHDASVLIGNPARLRELGWTPLIPIEQTLSDLLDDWRAVVRNGKRA